MSIVNVDTITGTPGGTDESIKDFIGDLYESRTASYWWDGHLGFVLLVGDYKDDDGNKLIERHLEPSPWFPLGKPVPEDYAADNWYACVSEDALHPAVMLGRLPVDDGTELSNIFKKVADYEPLPDTGWGRSVFLTAGRANPDTTPPWNYYAAETTLVHETFQNLLSLIPRPEFSVSILRGDTNDYPQLLNRNADSLALGRYITFYAIHGDPCRMGYENPRSFTACTLEQYERTRRPCVFMTFACQTARFDTALICAPCDTSANDCIGERFLTADDSSGAVVYIGPTDMGDDDQYNSMDIDFFESVFDGKVPFLGMAFTEMLYKQTTYKHFVNRMVILGDPALRMRYRESGKDSCDLWVRSDPSLFWFDPPMDTVPVPEYSRLKATIRNASDVDLSIPADSAGVAVRFSILTLDGEWQHLGTDTIRVVGAWDSTIAEAQLTRSRYSLAQYDFKIEVDPGGLLPEAHEDNNLAIVSKWIGMPPSVGRLQSKPSDSPTVAYLSSGSQQWEHYALFPCENSKVYVANSGGRILGSMTFNADDGPLRSVVVADLSNDDHPLAIVPSEHKISCVDLFEADTTIWQWDAGDTVVILSPPCVADFDGNGDLEVAVAASDTGRTQGLLIWLDGDGSALRDMNHFSSDSLSGCIPSCPLATLDLGDDGTYDVLVGTENGYLVAVEGSDGSVIHVKKIKDGYPVTGVVAGDFDLNGAPEIAAAADSLVRILRGDTTVKKIKFLSIGPNRVATGVAAGDVLAYSDKLAVEILVSHRDASDTTSHAALSVLSYHRHPLTPNVWEFSLEEELSLDDADLISAPVVGDLHSEAGDEAVVFTTKIDTTSGDKSTMWVWNAQSDNTVEFLRNIDGSVEGAVLCDFEGDLSPEIIFAASGDLSLWSATAGTGNGRGMEWPTALGDERGRNLHAVCLTDTLVGGQLTLWGRYVLGTNVRIPTADTLIIAPGTELRFIPSSSSPPSLISEAGARLIAAGRVDAPILLTSADPRPSPGDWGSVIRKICSPPFNDSLEHLVIEYATDGLDFLTRPICSPRAQCGVYRVRCCEFRNIESWGINFDTGCMDTLYVSDCLFKNSVVGGVRVSTANAEISRSRFLKDDSTATGLVYGIYSHSNGSNTWCRIEDNYLNAGDSFEADTSYWDYGIVVGGQLQADVEIRRNFLLSFRQCGISVDLTDLVAGSRVLIDTNCVRSDIPYHSAAGISFSGTGVDSMYVRGNIVFQNEYGVISDADPSPILGDTTLFWGYNHLVDNKIYIQNVAGDTLKAERCWWGEQPVDSLFIGAVDYTPDLEVEPSGVDDDISADESPIYALMPSHPNPFLFGNVRIRYSIPRECDVDVALYDVLGRRVRTLHSGRVDAGWHDLVWDGRNERGNLVGAGVYFYVLDAPKYRESKKMVILR